MKPSPLTFHLVLLKELICLKQRDKSFAGKDRVELFKDIISKRTLDDFWSQKASPKTLGKICNWLDTGLSFETFEDKYISPSKAVGPYKKLSDSDRSKIAGEIKKLLAGFQNFEDFKNSDNEKKENKSKIRKPIINIKVFNRFSKNFKILILSFRNPEDTDYSITHFGSFLTDRLKRKNEREKLGMEILYEPNIKIEDAEALGRWMKADIIIWGHHSKPKEILSHLIFFHYMYFPNEAKDDNEYYLKGETNNIELKRLVHIAEGHLNLEIDDIVYWFLGCKHYIQEDYNNALYLFERIKTDINAARNADLFFYTANCFNELGNINKAKEYYKKTLRINPEMIEARYNYALLTGSYEETKKYYMEMITMDPRYRSEFNDIHFGVK